MSETVADLVDLLEARGLLSALALEAFGGMMSD